MHRNTKSHTQAVNISFNWAHVILPPPAGFLHVVNIHLATFRPICQTHSAALID